MSTIKGLLLTGDGVNGTGTANNVMKWQDADTATDSIIYDDGTNVGIGTTPSGTRLLVDSGTENFGAIFRSSDSAAVIGFEDNSTTAKNIYVGAVANDYVIGTLATERMRIDSSGNVGIGTSSPINYSGRSALALYGATNGGLLDFVNSTGSQAYIYGGENGNLNIQANNEDSESTVINLSSFGTSGVITFRTNRNAERMRITSAGEFLFNSTTYSDGALNASIRGYQGQIRLGTNTTSTQPRMYFTNPNGAVGSINTSGTSTVYATSSDYRLKENVTPMEGALERVSQLQPSRFNFIADPETTVDGFLAHQVQEVVPEAITGEKDEVEEYEVTPAVLDDEGNVIEESVMGTRPVYQGIDQSKLVPLLVGAIQELKAEIETLKSQING